MQPEKSYKLILKSRIFYIPSSFRFLNDVDSNIFNILKNNGQYKIKSNIHEEVLQAFINHWVHEETPFISIDNISEFELLSQEFDRMKDIILLIQRNISENSINPLIHKNQKLAIRLFERKYFLHKKSDTNKETIELLFKKNQFDHYSQFLDVKYNLFFACNEENIKSVSFFTKKKIEINQFTYYLNEDDQTAILYRYIYNENEEVKTIFIPQSVNYESREYFITEIDSDSFNYEIMDSIQFPEDSKVKSINQNAFFESYIKSLMIPSSVTELKNGWCNGTPALINISISSQNRNFSVFNETFIIGKSDDSSLTKDVLFFARRDIETATIPSFIKVIKPYAFDSCSELKKVEFDGNSELISIEENAFKECSLESIVIPRHVFKIGENSFRKCRLKKVEFEKDSELQYIDDSAFSYTLIESIVIPSKVIHIGQYAFSNCEALKKIEFADGIKIRSFGKFIFQFSSIESISIPSSVVEFEEGWCSNTTKLIDFKISPNNHNFRYNDNKFLLGKSDPLKDSFDKLLFVRRDIEKVTIPTFIKQIESYAFCSCTKLKEIEFPENSEIQKINEYAFVKSSIEKLTFPSNITEISSYLFYNCDDFNTLEFKDDSKLTKINSFAFFYSSLSEIVIPSNVSRICENSFLCCKLKKVEFSKDSKLEIIEKGAFNHTEIEQILIPKHVKKICEESFAFCEKLKIIDFTDDSELKIIEKNAFINSSLEQIKIPSSLEILSDGWCSKIKNLNEVILMKDNQHFSYLYNSMIIGKSHLKSENFDTIYFANRNIENAIIPPFIRRIASNAFEECHKLSSIEFPGNSQLFSIGKSSFSHSSLTKVDIPQNLNIIEEHAFYQCNELEKVYFNHLSKLKHIESYAFCASSINEISIPPKVKIIDDCSFCDCTKLKKIHFSLKSELSIIDTSAFISSDISSISIPASVKYIGMRAFADCYRLKIIEIEENSKLNSINTEQFIGSCFKYLMIPVNLCGLIHLNFNNFYN